MNNIFTTETLDMVYLEYSNITTAKTAKELKLEREIKMMRECLEIIKEDKYEATPWLTVETGSAKRAKECLAKLTEDEE
jgi:hypothetical protein